MLTKVGLPERRAPLVASDSRVNRDSRVSRDALGRPVSDLRLKVASTEAPTKTKALWGPLGSPGSLANLVYLDFRPKGRHQPNLVLAVFLRTA